MFILILLCVLMSGCGNRHIHDTIESLPRGVYVLNRTSFSQVPPAVTPYVVRFLRTKGFLMDKLNVAKNSVRYKLYVHYTVDKKRNLATLYFLADNVKSPTDDAFITITRTIEPGEPMEQHIRLMVTALDNKHPILSGSGVASCVFEYGAGCRAYWQAVTGQRVM